MMGLNFAPAPQSEDADDLARECQRRLQPIISELVRTTVATGRSESDVLLATVDVAGPSTKDAEANLVAIDSGCRVSRCFFSPRLHSKLIHSVTRNSLVNLKYLCRTGSWRNAKLGEVATPMNSPSHERLVAHRGLAYIVIVVNIVRENYNATITTRR